MSASISFPTVHIITFDVFLDEEQTKNLERIDKNIKDIQTRGFTSYKELNPDSNVEDDINTGDEKIKKFFEYAAFENQNSKDERAPHYAKLNKLLKDALDRGDVIARQSSVISTNQYVQKIDFRQMNFNNLSEDLDHILLIAEKAINEDGIEPFRQYTAQTNDDRKPAFQIQRMVAYTNGVAMENHLFKAGEFNQTNLQCAWEPELDLAERVPNTNKVDPAKIHAGQKTVEMGYYIPPKPAPEPSKS
jgi:hypothetical protein